MTTGRVDELMSGWKHEAACKGAPVEWFFVEALQNGVTADYGRWGGTTKEQRRKLRKQGRTGQMT